MKDSSPKPSGLALVPLGVFAVFYVGLSLYAGNQGFEMPWYKVPYQPILALAILASFFLRARRRLILRGLAMCVLCGAFGAPAAVSADGELQEYAARTASRIAEIRATPNLQLPDGAVCRYLSERTGDDGNDGLTPATAWKTTARLDRERLAPGTFVLFARGGLYRGGFKAASGVTYTAYGTGDKPRIYSSPENGADPAKWRETEVPGVWAYPIGRLDVGTMVFNDGEAHAIKILPIYNDDGTYTQQYGKRPFDHGYADLAEDLHFWHDYSEKTDFKPFAKGTGLVYLRSRENPGKRFRSIEFNVRKHGIAGGGATDVTIDNLCIKYVGSHGIGFGTTKNLKVTNCEFGWIGGSIQAERIFGRKWAVRYGNAVEIYGGCENYVVDNCYVYEVYDAGFTHQYNLNRPDEIKNMTNVRYANNVIARCNYSIEYFLSKVKPENPSLMDGFVICSNLMWHAGTGFCEQRPDLSQAAHVKSWCNWANRAKDFVISDNVFCLSKAMLIEAQNNLRNPDGSDSLPRLERNVFISEKGGTFGLVCEGKPSRRPFDIQSISEFLNTLGPGNVCHELP